MSKIVYQYVNGGPDLTNQSPDFIARAQLFPTGLTTGNASLLLRNVSISDEGTFTCSVSSPGGTGSVNIKLKTAGRNLFL